MNTYKAFYKGKTVEVTASSSFEGQEKAAALLKAKKRYEVTVVLLAKGDDIVTHSTQFIGE